MKSARLDPEAAVDPDAHERAQIKAAVLRAFLQSSQGQPGMAYALALCDEVYDAIEAAGLSEDCARLDDIAKHLKR
jgi:hypothetical protein